MNIDNASITQKIRLRGYFQNVIPAPELVVDMFAGDGEIINLLWAGVARSVVGIEKLKKKSEACNDNTPDNVSIIHGDNRSYIQLTKDADIVDCDAYGEVFPLIESIVNVHQSEKLFISFTDGSMTREWHKMTPVQRANVMDDKITKLHPQSFEFEESRCSRVMYGWMYFRF